MKSMNLISWCHLSIVFPQIQWDQQPNVKADSLLIKKLLEKLFETEVFISKYLALAQRKAVLAMNWCIFLLLLSFTNIDIMKEKQSRKCMFPELLLP